MQFARLTLVATLSLAALAPGQAPGRTRTIVARVVDAKGAPIAGAGLVAGILAELTTQDALEKPLARSGADGRLDAKITYGPTDDYASIPALLITAPGKVSVTSGYVPTMSSAEKDETADLGRIVLLDGTTLRGRIVDAAGKPVAGALVTATDALQTTGGVAMSCRATTQSDAKGLFALPGAFDRALELTFTKDGWYQRKLKPVGRETPLTVEMKPSGLVSGKVVDGDGRGMKTSLTVTWECGASRYVTTGPDGTFRTTVWQPGRYRIRATLQPSAGSQQLLSPILDGPKDDVELRAAGNTGVRVVVRAVAADSKKELEEFSAFAFWSPGQIPMWHVLMHYGSRLVPCGKDHRVTLTPDAGRNGSIFVTAPGRAPQMEAVALGDTDTPKELTVELGPESVVTGKVLDEKGEALAGVRVWAVGTQPNSYSSYSTIPASAVLSAADGTFRIGGLGAGHWCVQALRDDLLVPDFERVELEAGKAREGVVIRLRAPASLRVVRAGGSAFDPAWTLRLDDPSGSGGMFMAGGGAAGWGTKFTQAQPLVARPGADGAFAFDKLDPKLEYPMTLLRPTASRFARLVELPAGTVKLPRDKPLELDAKALVPGTIKGKVDAGASGIALDRLVVLATPHLDPSMMRSGPRGVFAAATLDASGAFSLDVTPGNQSLCVIDVGSGQILWDATEPIEAKAGKAAEVQVELRATAVRVKLAPASAKDVLRVAYVTVTAAARGGVRRYDFARQMVMASRFEGIALEPGQEELELWLPPGEFTLKATSRAGFLIAGNRFVATELASEVIDVPEKGPFEVKLTIAAPPSTEELAGK